MSESSYSLAGIHLPENKFLVRKLKEVSHILSNGILVIAAFVLFGWITRSAFFINFLFKFFTLSLPVAVVLLLATTALLFSAKHRSPDNKKSSTRLLTIFIPIICGGIIGLVGIRLVESTFFLIGLAVAMPHTKFVYRYHITQLFILIIAIASANTILVTIFQLLSPTIPVSSISFNTAMMMTVFCYAVLMRWPNRGFLAIFTSDSASGLFALRLLVISLLVTPLLGFTAIVVARKGMNIYELVALVVLLFTTASILFAWVNSKLLYRFELERFLMREELRVHNIDLKLDKEEMVVKTAEMEKTKEQFKDIISYQNKFRDIAESLD
jgi:hypothetical protein